ncbi:MAG: hypothetical protein JHC98_00785 [Thermoleophilaceae bacterium]|nr:hypothetical protein [Thermoleophilaceae bacterium]
MALTTAAIAAGPSVAIYSPAAADPADPIADAIMPSIYGYWEIGQSGNFHTECKWDDGPIGGCGSAHGPGGGFTGFGVGFTEPFHDGPHTFTLTAIDDDTLESTTVVRNFYVLGPEIEVPWSSYDMDNSGTIEDTELTQLETPTTVGFKVLGDETYGITCRWDLATPVPCASPFGPTTLSPGKHIFSVHAEGAYYEDQQSTQVNVLPPRVIPPPAVKPGTTQHVPGPSGSDLRFSKYGLNGSIRLPVLTASNCPAHLKIRLIIPGHAIRRSWPGFPYSNSCRTYGSVGFSGAFKHAKKIRLEVLVPRAKKPIYVKRLTR